jgi:hypothetical protein
MTEQWWASSVIASTPPEVFEFEKNSWLTWGYTRRRESGAPLESTKIASREKWEPQARRLLFEWRPSPFDRFLFLILDSHKRAQADGGYLQIQYLRKGHGRLLAHILTSRVFHPNLIPQADGGARQRGSSDASQRPIRFLSSKRNNSKRYGPSKSSLWHNLEGY